jgi:uncharacterized protein
MPSSLRANLPDEHLLLIAAVSGRALATAARRAGYAPCVVDFYGDLDTQALTHGRLATLDAACGFTSAALIERLRQVADGAQTIGLVCGTGFEDRPQVLEELAQHWPLIGNAPEIVRRAKDPDEIAQGCERLAIPHPKFQRTPPENPDAWLIKQQGGGGGGHIVPAQTRGLAAQDYYQERVAGTPVSALLLGNGEHAEILGLSAQWTAPIPEQLFRFGGAVRPAFPQPRCAAQLCDAALQIAQAFALRGLNAIDFLVDGVNFHLIEVNPRPGATLDIFEDVEGRLLRAHVEACRGYLPQSPLVFSDARASTIAYAREDLACMPQLAWPQWCRDRQKPGTHVAQDEPICSIVVEAGSPAAARQKVVEKRDDFLRDLTAKASKLPAI